MFSHTRIKLVSSVVSLALLSIVCTSSDAGRAVRSDSGDSAFDTLGGFWGDGPNGTEQSDFGVPGVEGRTQFRLNLGNAAGPRIYTFCMSEEGFLRLVTSDTCDPTDYALPPAGNYIAVFATDLDSNTGGGLTRTRGFVDFKDPHKLPQAVPAMRFWWNGVSLPTGEPINVQIVLLDRSEGNSPGDFDIELNYGDGGPDSTPPAGVSSAGFQGFKLGPHSRGPTFGPFGPFDTNGTPIFFCFRGGHLRATCHAP